jgi:hypothetical protein
VLIGLGFSALWFALPLSHRYRAEPGKQNLPG